MAMNDQPPKAWVWILELARERLNSLLGRFLRLIGIRRDPGEGDDGSPR
jgi:hypothetical protein